MVKALIALPTGVPIQALNNVFAAVPGVEPRLVLDGIGAIVEVPPNLVQAVAGLPGLAAVATGAIANLAALPVPAEAIPWLQAWNKLFDPVFLNTLATRAAQWLNIPAPPCPHEVSGFGAPPPPIQDMRLVGDIAVGIMTIDGPAGTVAQITASEFVDITLSIIHGFDILYNNAPREVKLVFLAEPRRAALPLLDPASVPVAPAGGPQVITFPEYEERERMWRDPALQAQGFPAGFAGINAYRNNLLTRPWLTGAPQRSIVILVTKYNAAHFGYAANGRFVLQFPNALAAVGIDNLDRVIAHETCHLFNAPDEYGTCVPQQLFGPFNVPNGNCVNAHIPFIPHTSCLMAGETDDMCVWSKAHVGWNPVPFPIPPIL
jgi:hypothetical protein